MWLLDLIFPRRKDFVLAKSLDLETLSDLPRPKVPWHWTTALFPYKDDRIRALIWELKYKGNTAPLEIVGLMLYEEITAVLADIILFDEQAKFLLIPVPMTASARVKRGYNQSEYIAKVILEHDLEHKLLYAPQWFTKIKETEKQSKSSSREARLANLSGCFAADPRVAGFYVIIIDDVTTTGSTLSEARTVLLSSGARDVFAFTIAH